MNAEILRAVKNAKISEMLLVEVARTGSIKLAIDNILGAGRYEQIAAEVYEELRK